MPGPVSQSYPGPQDLPQIVEQLLRDAKVIDISIGVHRPDLRGSEAVQNLVRVAYRQGIQIGLFRASKTVEEEANSYAESLELTGQSLVAIPVRELRRRVVESLDDEIKSGNNPSASV